MCGTLRLSVFVPDVLQVPRSLDCDSLHVLLNAPPPMLSFKIPHSVLKHLSPLRANFLKIKKTCQLPGCQMAEY